MKRFKIFFILFLSLFIYSTTNAYEWNFDKDHSEVRFKVRHILTEVSGHFRNFEGKISFNPQSPEKSSLDFTVYIDSVDTNNGKRDGHLKSGDFFDAAKYPAMKFVSKKITRIDNNTFVADGMLTIKDVTKNISLKFSFLGEKTHPFMKTKIVGGFKSNFMIKRLDYSVGNGKFLKLGVVGNDVAIEIEMEALRDK